MIWTKLTPDNVPDTEVLAISKHEDFLVGYVFHTRSQFFVQDDNQQMGATHFITVKDLLEDFKKQTT